VFPFFPPPNEEESTPFSSSLNVGSRLPSLFLGVIRLVNTYFFSLSLDHRTGTVSLLFSLSSSNGAICGNLARPLLSCGQNSPLPSREKQKGPYLPLAAPFPLQAQERFPVPTLSPSSLSAPVSKEDFFLFPFFPSLPHWMHLRVFPSFPIT